MPSVHELIARRREVAAQIRTLQEELQRIDDAVYTAFEKVAAMLAPPPEPQRPPIREMAANAFAEQLLRQSKAELAAELETRTGERKRLLPGVMHVLSRANGPVKTRDLLDALAELNIDVGGKNPTNNLAAHLSSMDVVTSTPEGWVLTDRKR
ncbi:hypothetical protein ISF41_12490 [Burkholderia pseudomallei]|nr:hypothetical protein [Burkholderia pseudomallei]